MGLRSLLGRTDSEDAASSPDTAPGSPSLEELSGALRKGGRRKSKVERLADEQRAEKEVNDLIDDLFTKENWVEIAGLYFEARYFMTGYAGFRLEPEQKARLGASMAMMMKVLLRIDPRYVAMIVFSINFGTTIVSKEVMYREISKKIAAQNGRQAT